MRTLEQKYKGVRFGKSVVLSYSHKEGRVNLFNVICDCGNKYKLSIQNLKNSKKCRKCSSFTHGGRSDKEYDIWAQMKDRCLNVKNKNFIHYGGRGISVCEYWVKNYDTFIKDMGKRPSDKHSLDRIDNNGNYCKENCRWVTQYVQNNNKRNNNNIFCELNNKIYNTSKDVANDFKYSQQYICDMIKGRRKNKLKLNLITNEKNIIK